uniref:Uncharacterized protein n=1 Tax=Physcomitrium patens TaxID=3218 RepID=A0A7I4FVW3_PHYPA
MPSLVDSILFKDHTNTGHNFMQLLYEHTHPLCLVCIVDGLLFQKFYDPLFFLVEEYLYIPLCLIGEEIYDFTSDFMVYILRILRLNDHLLYQHRVFCKK